MECQRSSKWGKVWGPGGRKIKVWVSLAEYEQTSLGCPEISIRLEAEMVESGLIVWGIISGF